jgi:hypothetical protein
MESQLIEVMIEQISCIQFGSNMKLVRMKSTKVISVVAKMTKEKKRDCMKSKFGQFQGLGTHQMFRSSLFLTQQPIVSRDAGRDRIRGGLKSVRSPQNLKLALKK